MKAILYLFSQFLFEKKYFITPILAFTISISTSFSQRILAGEITYNQINNVTYEFHINTISLNEPADFISVDFGDGGVPTITSVSEALGNNYYINSYSFMRSFSGMGNYAVRVDCGDQMPGVVNSFLELNDPFYLYCSINIPDAVTIGTNNPPALLSGLNEITDLNDVYSFSINAYDAEGDSLKFELSTFELHAEDGDYYSIPGAENYIGIDSITGNFLWDKPLAYGRYFFAVKIYEYRDGVLLGWTMRTYMIDHYDPEAAHDIFIYPDPVTGTITINFGQNYFDQFSVNLYNITGQKIRALDFQRANNPTETIEITDLSPGSYLLNLMIAPKPISRVFIIPSNKL